MSLVVVDKMCPCC